VRWHAGVLELDAQGVDGMRRGTSPRASAQIDEHKDHS
jgi:hypothetical protein